MKIAIISDIHDNVVNLEKCLKWCRDSGCGALICCGDVTNSETLGIMAAGFSGPIHLVEGNVVLFDEDEPKKYPQISFYSKFGRFEVGNRTVGLCHELFFAAKVLELGPCDIIFYGHTHRAWEDRKHDTLFLNPGPLGGMFGKASFAVWDSDSGQRELKVLELL